MKRTKRDTLEQIVADAIAKEEQINKEHPERNGYGMIEGEADEFIRRIRALEYREDLAQRVKNDRITQRIRIVNSDHVYSRSPESVALQNIYKQKVNKAEKKIIDGLNDKSRTIYDMKENGARFTEISKIIGIHISNVSRNYYKTTTKLKEEFIRVLGKEIHDDN